MPLKTIAEFKISYQQVLDSTGKLVSELPVFAKDTDFLIKLYQMMVLTRTFDAKAIALQRTGKLGTYPSTLGQEAIGVAIGSSMKTEDVLCPYYRELGAQFWRGVKLEEILAFWGGEEEGSNYQGPREDFPICIPIASQMLHAVGVGLAFKIKQEARAVVGVIGDGGTSRGDFYEAMNAAGVWKLPVVFVVNNNQWAISVAREKQTAAKTIAQKAIAAGLTGYQVDGNDVIGLSAAIRQALDEAYQGKGPSVIEALSYRMCDHTTADDASRYREMQELEQNKQYDPIQRLKVYLMDIGALNAEKDKIIVDQSTEQVQVAVDQYLSLPLRRPSSIFDCLYETLPVAYEDQYYQLNADGSQA